MLAFSKGYRSIAGSALLVLPVALGCSAPRAAAPGAVEPVAPTEVPAAPAAAEEDAAPAPPPSAPTAPDNTAVNVITLIAKPGLWPLDVESARRVLQALGPVTREQPTENELSLVGGPYGALDRFSVAYTLDEDKYWVFGSAGFVLDGADRAQLYHTLEARLTQLLGKPTWRDAESDAELPTRGWDLGEAVTLSLAPNPEGSHGAVRIAISEPNGDRE
ncbi:MAG TPA: hypothetical protein VMG12_30730 [Polyangiaceae bacterium]|nr:hypothetical protein [Polyangiaceae bacterium]